MSQILFYLTVFAFSLTATFYIRKFTLAKKLLDIPSERSAHKLSTPRGGGLSIVMGFTIGLVYLYFNHLVSEDVFWTLLPPTLLIPLIGLWDDFGHIGQKWRFLTHLIGSLWAVSFIFHTHNTIPMDHILYLILFLFYVLSLAWLLNLFNFMDGIDGIASTETIFISLAGAFLCYSTGAHLYLPILILLSSTTLGFLVFNWPPAKIFMGDVASGFLGLTLGIIALSSSLSTEALPLSSWICLFGVFAVDATLTLLRRILLKQTWYKAHSNHAYQWAARKWGHKKVTLMTLALNIFWLLPLSLIILNFPEYQYYLLLLAYLPLIALALKLKAGVQP